MELIDIITIAIIAFSVPPVPSFSLHGVIHFPIHHCFPPQERVSDGACPSYRDLSDA